MMEFVIIVVAILVAQAIAAVAAVWLLCNDRVMKWYARKAYKMTKSMEEEMEKIYCEED